MKLGRLLELRAPQWQWRWRRGGNRRGGRLPGRVVALRLQPTFRTRDKQSPGRWSVSKQREPDIVLRVSAGDGHRFLVFDAKYRATRAWLGDAAFQAEHKVGLHVMAPGGEPGCRRASPTFWRGEREAPESMLSLNKNIQINIMFTL